MSENVIKYDIIHPVILVNDEKLAVGQECCTEQFLLDQHIKWSVKHRDLTKHFDVNLCQHIVKVTSFNEKRIIYAIKLRKKCVLIKVSENSSFISCPPNTTNAFINMLIVNCYFMKHARFLHDQLQLRKKN